MFRLAEARWEVASSALCFVAWARGLKEQVEASLGERCVWRVVDQSWSLRSQERPALRLFFAAFLGALA